MVELWLGWGFDNNFAPPFSMKLDAVFLFILGDNISQLYRKKKLAGSMVAERDALLIQTWLTLGNFPNLA